MQHIKLLLYEGICICICTRICISAGCCCRIVSLVIMLGMQHWCIQWKRVQYNCKVLTPCNLYSFTSKIRRKKIVFFSKNKKMSMSEKCILHYLSNGIWVIFTFLTFYAEKIYKTHSALVRKAMERF